MNYISIFVISFTIALSGALAPGPLLALVISGSLRYGGKTGPIVIAGHSVLEIGMVSILVFGLGRIINNPEIIKIISISGALILLYSGFKMFLSLSKVNIDTLTLQNKGGRHSLLFFQGITMSIANPYWTVWWLSVGLGLLLSANEKGITGLLFFFTGHILADMLWYSFVSYSIGKSKRFISIQLYKKIISLCASIIILFGLYFGFSAFL